MRSSICTRITIAALAACTMAAVAAPAWGQGDDITLRRDGSKAVPLVADLDPEPAAPADGFDWGDAAIGAGLGAAAALLAVTSSSAARGRRPVRAPRPRSGAASG